MNLILLEPSEIDAHGRAVLSGPRAQHAIRVLHAAPGQRIRVGAVDGAAGEARVTAVDGDVLTLECSLGFDVPDRPRVDLLLALPRPKVMRRLWAQLSAIGVGRIILTNAARVERNYFDTHFLAPDVYRPLLLEGLQQARDTRLPEVAVHRQLKVLVEDELDALCPGAVRLIADPAAHDQPADVLRGQKGERVLLAIGPEGGWTGFERTLLGAHGFRAIGVGPRTLRTDTACVALLAVVHEALRGAL